jgi:K+-sensing histidine kinase KdpD
VTADRSLLFRVVANLVDNCVKYGPRGGRISLTAYAADDDGVRIDVEDEGPGVPDDLRETIFDKYAQVERVRGGQSTNSRGLGLRFCRVVVDAHGGHIWVEDAEPTGARFCLELPA